MTHHRVKSSNLYSIAFEHDQKDKLLGNPGTMEVRFLCQACKGTGEGYQFQAPLNRMVKHSCGNCKGDGHTGTYRGKVPPRIYEAVKNDKSPGSAFNRLVRGNSEFRMEKQS